jgi:protein-disulfide isomerase
MVKFRACLNSKKTKARLAEEMRIGDKLATKAIGQPIPGTPLYLFDRPGVRLIRGSVYEVVIRRALEKVLDRSGPMGLPHGVDAKGHPWVGAKKPKLTIYEMSDYQCEHCRRVHARIRLWIEKHKDLREGVRLVHLQYPLGKACNPTMKHDQHPRACGYARAALCAKAQGRFWEMNDQLYKSASARRRLPLPLMARRAGLDKSRFIDCMRSADTKKALAAEVAYCEALGKQDKIGIEAVPTFFMQPAGMPLGRARTPTLKSIRAALRLGKKNAAAKPAMDAAMQPAMDAAMQPAMGAVMKPVMGGSK